MLSQQEASSELKKQVEIACEQFIERLQLIQSALLSSSTFLIYVKMLNLLKAKDMNELEQGKETIEKLLNKTDCSERKKELCLEYYEYAVSYLFPNQNILNEMTEMIEHGMAWSCYPFNFKGCSQDLRLKYSKGFYKMPEKSELERKLHEAIKNYLQYEFKNVDGDFFIAEENDKLDDILELTDDEIEPEAEWGDDDLENLENLEISKKEEI